MLKTNLFVTGLLIGSLVIAVPIEEQNISNLQNEIPTGLIKGLEKCSADGGTIGVVNCAAARVLKSVEKAERQQSFEIFPGVIFESAEISNERTAKEIKDENLPTDPQKKASKLLDMLLDATSRFLSRRTLKIKFPETTPQNLARAIEEGRGKMKKMMGPLLLGLGAKMVTVIPIMLGGLALLAAKALLIGKLAFIISVILFIQYFFSGRFPIIPIGSYGGYNGFGYGYGSTYGAGTYGTNNLGGWGYSGQYPYARSIDVSQEVNDKDNTGQDLAYAGHK